MTDDRTTELPRMQLHRLFEKHGVDYWCVQQTTFWNSESGSEFLAYQYQVNGVYKLAFKGVNVTPEQVIAATLGSDDEYEAKMDELLCRLTNGKWSKSRAYDLDFMVSCVDEEYEDAYEEERAELGRGTLTAEQVREAIKQHSFGIQPELGYGEFGRCFHEKSWQAIADELNGLGEE